MTIVAHAQNVVVQHEGLWHQSSTMNLLEEQCKIEGQARMNGVISIKLEGIFVCPINQVPCSKGHSRPDE
jgi:hypothetical protein